MLNGCWHPFVWQFNIQFLSSETEEALCQFRGLAQSKSSDYILEKKKKSAVCATEKEAALSCACDFIVDLSIFRFSDC